MDVWIAELWHQIETADWGTENLIGAIWDLCCLADCGLVLGTEIDRRLRDRCSLELVSLAKRKPPQHKQRRVDKSWVGAYLPYYWATKYETVTNPKPYRGERL